MRQQRDLEHFPIPLNREMLKCSSLSTESALGGTSETTTEQTIMATTPDDPQPIQDSRGASILGPRNIPLERENPDQLASPYTDSGTIPNLKFSFAAARNRLLTGGWAREGTARELPVATDLAGVNMRLKPGGIREMHWHKEAEWAYMLAGRARITAVDEEGRTFIDDVGVGDLWNFPSVIPHSIQGLEEGCEFLFGVRRRQFLGERDLSDHRPVRAHPARCARQEFRRRQGRVRQHP